MVTTRYMFGNKTMDKTFAAIHSRSNGFVGRMHFDTIVRLLGYGSIAFCIDEMLRVVDHAIKNVVAPFVKPSLLRRYGVVVKMLHVVPLGAASCVCIFICQKQQF